MEEPGHAVQDVQSAHELAGRVVVLTGAASGIGLALSHALRGFGCHVVELDRTPLEAAESPADERAAAGEHHRVVGDVTDPDANQRAVELAVREYGALHAFIGNAGVHDGGSRIQDLEPADMRDLARTVLDVNVVGYLVGACAAADAVVAAGGVMVFTLSDASYVVSGNGAGVAYAASKHAALGAVRSIAAQLAPDVRVNAVAPGGVVTPLSRVSPTRELNRVYEDVDRVVADIRNLNPLRTILSPEDLVSHYVFLLTSQSAGLTGHVLRPDGGLSVA
ncbi:SDR family oxidoreductase [Nocardioides sp. LHG3406-4]|uniref:SDR family oxidoreductase n=1 Tax=Nocardioides sp. LHG3406-4 TaxID=2804575 RepID=UPI003CEB008B